MGENMIVSLMVTLMIGGGVFFGGIYYSTCRRNEMIERLPLMKQILT